VQPSEETKEESPYNILSYNIDTRRNGILIEILLRETLHYEWFLTDGEWINLTFDRGRLNPQQMQASQPHPEVIEVVAHQFDNSAQLSFRMSMPVEKYLVTSDPYSPKRVLVMITGSAHGEIPGRGRTVDPGDAPWVVVLDPGHGGHDRGIVGRKKRTLEKDVTLSIAERAARLFERNPRFRVRQTRSGDDNVPAEARIRTAREARSDIFISIHANSSRTLSVHGCKTYFCGKGTAARVIASAGEPVKAPAVDTGDAVTSAASDSPMAALNRSSQELARLILDKIASSTQSPCLGVARRNSPFLARASRTSVRIAAGFLSNPADEALLRKKSYQARIAEAIYLGVVAYRDKHERREFSATR
jgi:N-acetylmuramoyl-L-alanine amidase